MNSRSSHGMWKRKFWYRFTVITMYFSAGMIPIYLNNRMLGLVNSFWVYVIPSCLSVYNMVLVKTNIEAMSPELEESAYLDGAGYLTRFFKIVMPLQTPILATISLFTAVNQWNDFFTTKLYITNTKLHDHAQACIALGKELNVPVLDLHQAAMEDIIRLGRDASKIYYHQGDWTHTNDYGAVRAAGYAADALRSLGGTFPEYLPLIQAVSASIKPWKPEAALLLEKSVRLAGVKGPNGTEEGTAAQDHQAEKDGGDALARLLAAVQSARGQGG